ncbi:MAG TPA: hypothetical protein ENK60_09275 [Anaerolineae bacterium]|nr:hypothetical protein [Anaerolineae bacterium]
MNLHPPSTHRLFDLRWVWLSIVILGLMLTTAACKRDNRHVQDSGIGFTLQRLTPEVSMGKDASSLQPLTSATPSPVSRGMVITTNDTGEGVLRGALASNETCTIHIFFDTSLRVSACSRAMQHGGATVTCQEEGTAVYQGCVANLQQTPSGMVQIVGSWVVISYQPEMELTLVSVLEGEAQVRAVIDPETAQVSETWKTIPAGHMWYTTPGETSLQIGDLPPREALSLNELPTIVEAAKLTPWYDRVRDEAIEEGVAPEDWQTPIEIQGGGGPLTDPAIGRAVMMSIDWEDILGRISLFPGPAPVSLPDLPGRTTADFPYNPDRAQALLKTAGAAGPIGFYVVMEDGAYMRAASRLEAFLAKVDIFVGIIPIDPEHATAVIEDVLGKGAGVIWIGPTLNLDIPALTEEIDPIPSPSPAVQGGGGPLEDPFVGRAVLTAIDWRALQLILKIEDPIPITFPGLENVTSDDFPYDPVYARQILGESGADGHFPIILVVQENEPFLKAADAVRTYLTEIGVKTAIYPTKPTAAPDILTTYVSNGQAVFWLGPAIHADWHETVSTEAPPIQISLSPQSQESGALTSLEEVFPNEWRVGDTHKDATVQMILSFDITDLPMQAQIIEAWLDLSEVKTMGQPFTKLGCLRAYLSPSKGFSIEAFAWEPELGAVARWCSEEDLLANEVQDDIVETLQQSLGTKRYRLRLQFNEGYTNYDQTADLLIFREPHLHVIYTLP